MSRRREQGALSRALRAAAVALLCVGPVACQHDTPPPQNATHASSGAASAGARGANPTAVGVMPVGSIKEDKGDIRYVNPTLPNQMRPDAGAASTRKP